MNATDIIKKSLIIFLPESNFNETEYSIVKNTLEQNGYRVFMASDAVWACTGNLGLRVKADVSLYNVNFLNFAGIILIGGEGVKNYWDNTVLHAIVKKFYEANKIVAAICSAPVVLARAGILRDKEATCFQKDKKHIISEGAEYSENEISVDGNIITGREPSAAHTFVSSILNSLGKN